MSSQAPLLGLEVVNVVVDDFVVVVILRTLRNKYLHVMAVDGDNFISNDWLQQFKYLTLIDFLTVFWVLPLISFGIITAVHFPASFSSKPFISMTHFLLLGTSCQNTKTMFIIIHFLDPIGSLVSSLWVVGGWVVVTLFLNV